MRISGDEECYNSIIPTVSDLEGPKDFSFCNQHRVETRCAVSIVASFGEGSALRGFNSHFTSIDMHLLSSWALLRMQTI